MTTNLDWHDILNWMDGCSIGSHLRQGIWDRAIDEFYPKLSSEERKNIYTLAKRDLLNRYMDIDNKHVDLNRPGAREFLHFLARFNPANQHMVMVQDDTKQHELTVSYKTREIVKAFLDIDANGLKRYYVGSNRICAPEYIKKVKHQIEPYTECDGSQTGDCPLRASCVRYNAQAEGGFVYYTSLQRCERYIDMRTPSGVKEELIK